MIVGSVTGAIRGRVVSIALLAGWLLGTTALAETTEITKISAEAGVGIGTEITVDLKEAVSSPLSDVFLFLDGTQLKDIPAQLMTPVEPSGQRLKFRLIHTGSNDAAWRSLLGRRNVAAKGMELYLGTSAGARLTSPCDIRVKLGLFLDSARLWVSVLLELIVATLVIVVARSGALQDAGRYTSLSLGRIQMALWTLVITSSFLFIWAATGNVDAITAQCVGLMGISATTALGAAAVDAGRDTSASDLRTIADARATKAVSDADLRAAIKKSVFVYRGAIRDLLHDDTGPSLHRAQMAAWTLVLLTLFVYSVWNNLSMPNFDSNLVALMGVSSGMYVGFKFTE